MKKAITLTLLFVFSTACFSQQKDSYTLTRADYLKKAKNQKKIATILLVSGAGLIDARDYGFNMKTAIVPGLFYNPPVDYLRKSKNQKTAAWILLGGGAALIVASIAIPEGEVTGWNLYSGYDHKNDGVKIAFFVTGILSAPGSIHFFIASKRNKRRAMSTSAILKMERAVVLQQNSATMNTYPAAAIRINLL